MSWLNERRPYNPFSAFGPNGPSVDYYVPPSKPKDLAKSSTPQPASSRPAPKSPRLKRSETPVLTTKTGSKPTSPRLPADRKSAISPKPLKQKDKPKQKPSVSTKTSKPTPKVRTDGTKQQLGPKRGVKPSKTPSDAKHSKEKITKHNFI